MPDLYRHSIAGEYKTGVWLRDYVNYNSMVAAGAEFETDGFEPLVLEIREGFLTLIARSDPAPLTLDDRCDFQTIADIEVGTSEDCGDERQVTLVEKIPVGDLFDNSSEWVGMTVRVAWSKYDGLYPVSGRVLLFINKQLKTRWLGEVGRNDEIGPYLTVGAGMDAVTNPMNVEIKDLSIKHNIVGFNVNLIKNPNNFGQFKDTWDVSSSQTRRGLSPYLHNQVNWAYGGAVTGFFATPFYPVTRRQEIDLQDFLSARNSNKPVTIFVGEQFNRTYCGGDRYYLTVRLLDENRELIDQWSTGNKTVNGPCEWSDPEWLTEKHAFPLKDKLPRYIQFIDGGRDKEFWGGYYGSRMREATVILEN